jgi:integrase
MFGVVRATQGASAPVSVDFQWRYKVGGKTRQVRIGSWPKLSLKAIRDQRDKLAAEVKNGSDPVERKATEKLKTQADRVEAHHLQLDRLQELADRQARLTVKELFDLWQKLALRQRKDKGSEAQRAFERDVFPLIGNMAIVDVKKAHIQNIVDTMMERDVVRMTKRVLSDLRQMFGFALDRDYIEADPTARIKKKNIGPDGERDRVFSEAELVAFFAQLPRAGLAETTRYALLIQLSTLTRVGEVVSAKWEHVDFERRLWLLPHTKNGKSHQVWLNDFALRHFELLKEITGATPWCFPSSRYDVTKPETSASLDQKTVTKQVADRQCAGNPLAGRTKLIDALMLSGGQWRPHDLRRTGASKMAELGVLSDVIDRCLNHTEENKMKRIYQRATYEGPMRDAWRLWGERLDLLCDKPMNVLTLRAA